MELFVVNRYTGDDGASCSTANEAELKQMLLDKVEQRKKLMKEELKGEGIDISECGNSSGVSSTVTHGLDKESDFHMTEAIPSTSDMKIKKKGKKSKHAMDSEETETATKKKKLKGTSKTEDEIDVQPETSGSGSFSTTDPKSFTVLGTDSFSKPTKVKRSIPHWLANPSIVSLDLKSVEYPLNSIPGLDPMFIERLKHNKITHFFPVQKQVIPWLLENMRKPNFYWPNDVCVSAPTGSGKTLAFVLPILQSLRERIVPEVRALVILPVQDLAAQVFKVFEAFISRTTLKVLLLSKTRPFEEEQKLICRKDESGCYSTLVDIVVTTPGRLVDHLTNTQGLSLHHLRYLVIDEADRVIEEMQNDWLYHLNKKIVSDSSKTYQAPVLTYSTLALRKRLPQKLLFSATLSQDPEKLQQLGLFQPKLFTSVDPRELLKDHAPTGRFLGKYTTPIELQEYFTLSSKSTKPLIIHHLLLTNSWRSVLCFVNSNEATKRLSFLLKKMNKSITVKNISAKLNPMQRDQLLQDFGAGKIDVLISSDALARGIDIPNVKYVISYNCPKYLKGYVHRIGRTARAGKEGVSLILLTQKENEVFKQMMETAGKKSVNEMLIEDEILENYIEDYKKALSLLESSLEKKRQIALAATKTKKRKNKTLGKMFLVKNVSHKK